MAYFEIFRGTQAEVNAQAIIDGQILYTTDLGVDDKIYKDVGSTRTILSNDNGVTQSENIASSNLGTVYSHKSFKKSGIGRYKLTAISGTWTSGTNYTLGNLSAQYRPTTEVGKVILLGGINTQIAYMYIQTGGNVIIQPRVNMTAVNIFIDETYII